MPDTSTGNEFRDLIANDYSRCVGHTVTEKKYRTKTHGGERRIDVVTETSLKSGDPWAIATECKWQSSQGTTYDKLFQTLEDFEYMMAEQDCYWNEAAIIIGGGAIPEHIINQLRRNAKRVRIIEYEEEWQYYLLDLQKRTEYVGMFKGQIGVLEAEQITERIYKEHRFTHYENGWLYGVWYCGTGFQKAIYHGQFPLTFVKRVISGFPPDKLDFLHLCCGRCHIDNATNVDIMDLPEVDIIADAESLPFDEDTYDVCLIDPPYSQEDSTRYGVPRLISVKKTMVQLARIIRPGGWVLWLDEKYPQVSREDWKLSGLIGIVTGANRRARFLSMFRRLGESSYPKYLQEEQLALLEEKEDYG